MPLAQLISPQQLAERQQSSGWVILDCRFAWKTRTTACAVTPKGISRARNTRIWSAI